MLISLLSLNIFQSYAILSYRTNRVPAQCINMPHASTVPMFNSIVKLEQPDIFALISFLFIVILNASKSVTILNGIFNTYTLNFFDASFTARTSIS